MRLVLILLGCTLSPFVVGAQPQMSPTPTLWGGAGVGFGSEGLAMSVSASYRPLPSGALTLRYTHNVEATTGVEPLKNLYDVGLMYGRVYRQEYWLIAVSGGVSFVQREERGAFLGSDCDGKFCLFSTRYYESVITRTAGIPVEVQFNILPASLPFSAGVHAYANVNDARSFAGVTVQLQFLIGEGRGLRF